MKAAISASTAYPDRLMACCRNTPAEAKRKYSSKLQQPQRRQARRSDPQPTKLRPFAANRCRCAKFGTKRRKWTMRSVVNHRGSQRGVPANFEANASGSITQQIRDIRQHRTIEPRPEKRYVGASIPAPDHLRRPGSAPSVVGARVLVGGVIADHKECGTFRTASAVVDRDQHAAAVRHNLSDPAGVLIEVVNTSDGLPALHVSPRGQQRFPYAGTKARPIVLE